MKNPKNYNNIDRLKMDLELLDSPWEFQGIKKLVKVDTKIIKDINYNFLGCISDFYFIKSIDKLENFTEENIEIINTLVEISNHHRFLLFLKYFYLIEIKKYLDYITKSNHNKKSFILDFQPFKTSLEIWNYLFSKSDKNTYPLKILILTLLYDNLLSGLQNKELSDNIFLSDEYTVSHINKELSLLDSQYSVEKYLEIIVGNNLIRNGINSSIENLIKDFQIYLLSFNQNKSIPHDVYLIFNKLSSLKLTIDKFSKKIEDNNLKDFYNSKVNCLASAFWNNNKYIAINGLDTKQKSEKIIEIINELSTPEKYEYIRIPLETKYFLNKHTSLSHKLKNNITYREFNKYKSRLRKKDIPKKDINVNNRMFTCCERKLISYVIDIIETKGVNKENIPALKLTITMKPCSLCKRTINIISQENKLNLTIIHSDKSSDLPNNQIKKYDNFAIEIIEYYNQNSK